MDEVLKRRLVGAIVLLTAAFLFSLILPKPGANPVDDDGTQRVTFDMTQPQGPAEVTPANAVAEPGVDHLPPPEPAASAGTSDASASVESSDDAAAPPHMESPGDDEEPAQAEPAAPARPVTAVAQAKPELKAEPKAAPAPKPEQKPAAAKPEAKPATQVAAAKPEAKPAPKPAAAKPESKPAAAPAKAEIKPVAAPAKPAAAAPAVAAAKAWYIQVGGFADINNAHAALDKLKPAHGVISPADTPKGTLYRVRLGPYASKEKAVTERDKLAPHASVVEN